MTGARSFMALDENEEPRFTNGFWAVFCIFMLVLTIAVCWIFSRISS
jgi:hypothetical protein